MLALVALAAEPEGNHAAESSSVRRISCSAGGYRTAAVGLRASRSGVSCSAGLLMDCRAFRKRDASGLNLLWSQIKPIPLPGGCLGALTRYLFRNRAAIFVR